jgi:hypothetical protein
MTWRDEALPERMRELVIEAIDAYALILPYHGINVSEVFWQEKDGPLVGRPAVTIILKLPGGKMPGRSFFLGGWGIPELELRQAVWAELDKLAPEATA